MLNATIKPPNEKPSIAKERKLTSPKYSGVKNKYGMPYLTKIPFEITATMIDQIIKRIGLFFMWTKNSWIGKKYNIFRKIFLMNSKRGTFLIIKLLLLFLVLNLNILLLKKKRRKTFTFPL